MGDQIALSKPQTGKEMQSKLRAMWDDAVLQELPGFVENVERWRGEVSQSVTLKMSWVPASGENDAEIVIVPKHSGGSRTLHASASFGSPKEDGTGKKQLCLFT